VLLRGVILRACAPNLAPGCASNARPAAGLARRWPAASRRSARPKTTGISPRGGHIDPTDPGLPDAARRELAEETGIGWQQATSAPGFDRIPLDIDLHLVPANPAKGEPSHWHADFRYVFLVSDPAVVLRLEEVSDYAWLPPSSLQTARLAAKVGRLTA
jgi:ADP-ribose pyrophosphatase YjhB (NUDIX family)